MAIQAGGSMTKIGGTARGSRNIISANGLGITMSSGAVASSNNVIQGNYIGTDITGTQRLGNRSSGIDIINSDHNTIGGTTPESRNVISAQGVPTSGGGFGVSIGFAGAFGNQVLGNYIGTDVTGTIDLGNLGDGVFIDRTSDNTLGGTTPGAGNLISGNNKNGVNFAGSDGAVIGDNVVQGNRIGTAADGTSPLGNGLHGVLFGGSTNGAIGGTTAGAGNTIAFNAGDGVFLSSGTGNALLSNSIFSNTGLGIDLGTDGIKSNDTGDGDTGANNLQNFPVLTSVGSSASNTVIEGTLNSTANGTFTAQFFSNTVCDASGNGEGERYLGDVAMTSDGSGNASFMTALATTVPSGHFVTATATDSAGDTSEFSKCQVVVAISDVNDPPVANPDTATVAANSTAGTIDVLANDTPGPLDESGQTLSIIAVTQGDRGSVAITGGGTGVSYAPNAGSSEPDSFTYTVCDDGTTGGVPDSQCATGTVTIRITHRPTTSAGSATTLEDTAVTIDLLSLVSDEETAAADMTYVISSGPGRGTVTPTATNGVFTYTPGLDYFGPDSFEFHVVDRGDPDNCGTSGPGCAAALASDNATLSITVTPVNDKPTARSMSASTDEDTTGAFTLVASDMDSPSLSFTIVGGPSHGSLGTLGTPSCSTDQGGITTCTVGIVYTPEQDFHGSDSFTFRASDGTLDSDIATITVTVNSVPDPLVFFVPRGGLGAPHDVVLHRNGSKLEILHNGTLAASMALVETSRVEINGKDGQSESLTIHFAIGGFFALTGGVSFSGGGLDSDSLKVIGTDTTVGTYTPSGSTSGSGIASVNSGAETNFVTVGGAEAIEVSRMDSYTLRTPNSNDVLAVNASSITSRPNPISSNVISGTSGGVPIVPLTFFDIAGFTNGFTIDATAHEGRDSDNNDSITINNPGLIARGLANFSVVTGNGSDTLRVFSAFLGVPQGSATAIFTFDGGPDVDRIIASADVNYTLGDTKLSAAGTIANANNSIDLVNLAGEQAILTGGNSPNTIQAQFFTGSVTMDGGAGTDALFGGTGADLLIAGPGGAQMFGGPGDDILVAGPTCVGQSFNGGPGSDTLDFSVFGVGVFVFMSGNLGNTSPQCNQFFEASLPGIENATGTPFNDSLSGNIGPNVLNGGAGNDTINGREGNDSLVGGLGNDSLLGSTGDDSLDGGDGKGHAFGWGRRRHTSGRFWQRPSAR